MSPVIPLIEKSQLSYSMLYFTWLWDGLFLSLAATLVTTLDSFSLFSTKQVWKVEWGRLADCR